MKRRLFLTAIFAGALSVQSMAYAAGPLVEVYKSESCGCCTAWVEHLEKNGFTVKATNVDSPGDYRQKFGMPEAMGSCHSAKVGGYAIEGHVPAADIKRLLKEKPKAVGLAVPSMPMGSPGMEGPRSDPYDVFLVNANGSRSVFTHYDGK